MQIDYLGPPPTPLTDYEQGLLQEKVDIDAAYSLPLDVKFCTNCVISNQRPRIAFSESGVCNACSYWLRKNESIDWSQRKSELSDLCDRFRRSDGSHDVVVPSSGGKDSVYVAHLLKYEFKMNPLTVTWAPALYTSIGFRNLMAQVHAGLDNILYTPNGRVHRTLTRLATIELGDPFQPFIYGQANLPLRVAVERGIGLVMDGENGEVEYGGAPQTESLKGFSAEEAEKYWLSGFPLEHYLEKGFTRQDLFPYAAPPPRVLGESKVERHFFSYYVNWQPQSHFYYAVENSNFLPNEVRSEGTFSKYASLDDRLDPFHYYFALLKFGLGRATSDAAHEIREGLISREEGAMLVRKFDCEPPSSSSSEVFRTYTGLTSSQLELTFDRWRNSRLWQREGDSFSLVNSV